MAGSSSVEIETQKHDDEHDPARWEKTVPWRRRVVTYATSSVLLVLGILVLAAPDALPALTIPSGDTTQMG